jgi:hypothetical protein
MTAMIGINDRFIFRTSARLRGGRGDRLSSTNEGIAAWFHSSRSLLAIRFFKWQKANGLSWLIAKLAREHAFPKDLYDYSHLTIRDAQGHDEKTSLCKRYFLEGR